MACRSCGSETLTNFPAEISIHFPGIKNIDKPTIWVFPKLLVCMDCGFAELVIAENELLQLGKTSRGDLERVG
jgi:hypothetical protein